MAALVPVAVGHAEPAVHEHMADSLVPADIAACLSQEQVARLKGIMAARTTPHVVDYRITTSLFGRKFYAAFFAGNEARAWDRLKKENQIRPLSVVVRDALAVCAVVTLSLCALSGLVLLGIYLAQPLTGFRIFLS